MDLGGTPSELSYCRGIGAAAGERQGETINGTRDAGRRGSRVTHSCGNEPRARRSVVSDVGQGISNAESEAASVGFTTNRAPAAVTVRHSLESRMADMAIVIAAGRASVMR